jgi:hypothetical protein
MVLAKPIEAFWESSFFHLAHLSYRSPLCICFVLPSSETWIGEGTQVLVTSKLHFHPIPFCILVFVLNSLGARDRIVGRGTMLQAGRSLVRVSDEEDFFLIYLIFPAALWPWGRLSLQQESVSGMSLGVKAPAA